MLLVTTLVLYGMAGAIASHVQHAGAQQHSATLSHMPLDTIRGDVLCCWAERKTLAAEGTSSAQGDA